MLWILASWLHWAEWMPPGHFPIVGIGSHVLVVEEWTYIEDVAGSPDGPHLEVFSIACDDIFDEHQCGYEVVWRIK